MRENNKNYVSVMLTLSILSLEQDFIPDYLFEKIKTYQYIDELENFEMKVYKNDIKTLNKFIEKGNYQVLEDEHYKKRVELLLK